ncbi:MAG: type II secretion system F family protein [Microthrixaceae bacterium]
MRNSPRRLLGICSLLCAVSALVLGSAPTVSAQDDEQQLLRVETVNALGDDWQATGLSNAGTPTVSADGEELASEAFSLSTDIVVVLDNDRGLPNGTLQLAGNAVEESLLPGMGNINNVAVVSTGKQGSRQEIGLSSDPAAVTRAIDTTISDGDAATWDALTRAADLLASSTADSQRVVAFLSASDKLSRTTPGAAATSLRLEGAQLDVIELPAGINTTQVSEMVADTGGSVRAITSDEQFSPATSDLARQLDSLFGVLFAAPGGDESMVELTFAAGDAEQVVAAERGAVVVGSADLAPSVGTLGLLDRITSNSLARWLLVALIAAAVIGFVWALLSLVTPDENDLSRRLRAYDEGGAAEGEPEEGEQQGHATVPLLQRAVQITGDVAEKRGFLESLEVNLERANLPLRAAEALFFLGALSLLLGVATYALTGNILFAIGALILTLMLPKVALDMKVRRRQKAFVAQLPDMLALLAGTLKAGYSITQGFEAVSREVDDPMGKELRRVVTEHRLGRTLEDALDATADRMGSEDFAWTVMAIKIQREVGGNLAELLLTVANTMTQRERLRRDVNSLTAEGRISAFILGILPPGLAVVMYVMNRDYIVTLFDDTLGYVFVGAALVAMAIGFAWMKKIITIEV